jgi:glutathione S-transferase
MNAAGKVPALKDDELVITESSAICLYLAEKAGQLLPQPATAASAKHHQWISFIGNELEQPLWTSAKHKFALPESLRQEAILPVAQWEFEKAVAVAEQWTPKEGFLLGEQFTVADILLAHTLNWALKFEQKLPEKLAAYRKRVSARPALARALEKEQGL